MKIMGAYGYPLDKAARVAIETAANFLAELPDDSPLMIFRFSCFFRMRWQRLNGRSPKSQRKEPNRVLALVVIHAIDSKQDFFDCLAMRHHIADEKHAGH
jgi:hypothetical protein